MNEQKIREEFLKYTSNYEEIIRVKLKKNDAIKNYAIVEITIIEGRNHIVKKVFENLGYLVDKLTRVEYAFLNVDKLKSGEYRSLSIKEVKKLYEYKN